MILAGLSIALLAAALHIFIFYIESLACTTKGVKIFGLTPLQAEQTKEMAYNQGFYNLFLALIAIIGTIFHFAGSPRVGLALALAGTGSMLAAALVLFLSSPEKRAAAIKQGALPLLAVALLAIGALS